MTHSATSPNPPPRLRRDILWTFAANMTANVAQFALVSALAHWANPQTVGQYSYGLAITAPLFLWLGFQLRNVMVTDIQEEFSFSSYLALRMICLGLALVLCLVLIWQAPNWSVTFMLAVAKLFEGMSDLLYAQLQRANHLDWIAQGTLLRGMLGLTVPLALFVLSHQLTLAVAGVAVVNLILLLAHDYWRARPFLPRFQMPGWRPLRTLLGVVWPLGVVAGLISLSANVPRIAVEHQLGSASQGIYSALSYAYVVGSVVVMAMGTALTTQFAQRYAGGQYTAFLKLTAQFAGAALLVGSLLVLGGAVAGPPVIRVLFGPEYAEHQSLFIWLLVAGTVGYVASAVGVSMTGARRFKEQLPLFAVVAVALYLLCERLIPAYGLLGAAYASLIAFILQLLGSLFILFFAVKNPPAQNTSAQNLSENKNHDHSA